MVAVWIVEHLNVLEHVLSCGVARLVSAPPDPLPFQQLKKAFSNIVIVTVNASAHARFQIVLRQESLPFSAGDLRTLIGIP